MAETTLNPIDFRNALACFASGVTVVTTQDREGRQAGFTASAFSSLSLDPPLVLVCLEKKAHSYEAFMQAEGMAISVLAADQLDLAWRFASKDIDKFAGLSMQAGDVTGMPLVPNATVHLETRMHGRLDGGDHTILVGEVVFARTNDQPPLLHFNRKFGRFQESAG